MDPPLVSLGRGTESQSRNGTLEPTPVGYKGNVLRIGPGKSPVRSPQWSVPAHQVVSICTSQDSLNANNRQISWGLKGNVLVFIATV